MADVKLQNEANKAVNPQLSEQNKQKEEHVKINDQKKKKKPYPPDYRDRRMKKMKKIEQFLLEEVVNENIENGFEADIKYLDELDYHLGDFVFKLKNPDHPSFVYNKESNITKFINGKIKKPKIRFSELSMMADLILHSDTPFETIRSENHLINLALFRVFKRISDYTKIRDDANQEEYHNIKEKYNEPNEKMLMIKYTTDMIDVFETIPKPPKDRKKNRQYKKANMIVDDDGYANPLKNSDIKIPVANIAGESSSVDQRLPYLKKDKNGKWVRTENPVSDFTTLFRNYLIYKITAQGGFKIRQFMSHDGASIFIVLYTSFENLKVQASLMGLNKTFALTQTDIFSLEPVDSRLRPLRLNHQLKLLTPELKEGSDQSKHDIVKKEREKREQVKKELFTAKYKQVLQKEMVKYKGNRFISDSDYTALLDDTKNQVKLSPSQIDIIIDNQIKLKYIDQVEEAKKSLLSKQNLLAETIQNERKKIRNQINRDIDLIPLLQHSASARKFINSQGISNSSQHNLFFEVKLDILKSLFNINMKQLAFECGSTYLQTKEEILDNCQISFHAYLAYKGYLLYLETLVDQVRKKYEEKDEYEMEASVLKQLMCTKREIDNLTLTGRIKKSDKSFIKKRIKTTKSEEYTEVFIPAVNWKKYRYAQMQQDMFDAFQLALRQAKRTTHGGHIKTIWDYYGHGTQQVFSDFIYVPSSKRITNKILLENCWERTPINLNERTEVFNKMERIKITTALLISLFDFSKLKSQEDLIADFFPLHDKFQLSGQRKHSDYFRKVIENKIAQDYKDQNQLLEQLTKSRQFYEQQLKNNQMLVNLCLLPNWSSILPYIIPEQEICDYFGVKIALYFSFLSFYFKHQFFVAILSIPVFVVYQYYKTEETGDPSQIAALLHIILVVIWANVMCGEWNYSEVKFSLKYNQTETDDEEDIRPGFQGEYERSITSNKLNEYSYDKRKTASSERWYWLVIIIFILINIVIIYALIYLQSYFDDTNMIESGKTFIALNILIPTIILEFIFVIEEILFKKFALFTCRKANFKTNKEFEQSYATKLFTFIFLNHLVPPTLISFIIDLNIGCVQNDCLYHLSAYVRSYQYIVVCKNFIEIFYPIISNSVSKVGKLVNQLVNKDQIEDHQRYLYDQINIEIEDQSRLNNSVSDGIDLPTKDYVEIFSYYCFNVTYGFGFPLVFVITLLLTLIKLAVSKSVFCNRIQRPNPQNASTIGIFKQFMNIGASLSILTYTGVFCFTRQKPDWEFSQLNAFTVLTFAFFVIKFLIGRYYSDIDTQTQDLLKRQSFILENHSQRNKLTTSSSKTIDPIPFNKIYGAYLEDKQALAKKQN